VTRRRSSASRTGSVYVLALLEAGSRVPSRIAGRRIAALEVDGIVAAVERRKTAPPLSERSLRAQHRILVALHDRAAAILPVRFGGLTDETALAQVVRLRRSVLGRALRKVRGRTQMTIRFFDSGTAETDTVAPSPRSGTAYLEARARAARVRVPPIAAAIRRAVASLVAAESIERGQRGVGVVIHHLIGREDVERYRARVARVLDAGGEPVMVSGPLPPSAFAPDIMDAAS
jgi:hypothetical protein